MFSSTRLTHLIQALSLILLVACSTAAPVQAGSLVTYTWVTGSHLGDVPTSATFQVDLATVQTGTFGQFDIQNIEFTFPGIGPLSFTTGSSIGFDNAAFVDLTTGLPTFHDANQGLAVVAYQDSLFSNTFLSILFDNPSGSMVDDTYNAINGGPGSLGFGHGFWQVSGYTPQTAIPEPPSGTLLGAGATACGLLTWRRRRQSVGRTNSATV